jgi:hypothetical protein
MSATQQIINIGALPNDGQGDPLRIAFGKINNNFSNLFATFTNTSTSYTNGNAPGQIIFQAPANEFTQAVFYIQSSDTINNDSQSLSILSQLNTQQTLVNFTATGFTYFGNCLATFDMAVVGGNVVILCNPLVSDTILHFIGSQIMYVGEMVEGQELALDGYANSVMATENNNNITTET